MQKLITNKTTEEDIQKLKEYAKRNVITQAQLKLIKYGDLPPVGDNPDFVIYIEDGFRIVYSLDEQPMGLCHHLSVSYKKLYPNPVIVKEIMGLFGMIQDFKKSYVHIEKPNIINIIQKVE